MNLSAMMSMTMLLRAIADPKPRVISTMKKRSDGSCGSDSKPAKAEGYTMKTRDVPPETMLSKSGALVMYFR